MSVIYAIFIIGTFEFIAIPSVSRFICVIFVFPVVIFFFTYFYFFIFPFVFGYFFCFVFGNFNFLIFIGFRFKLDSAFFYVSYNL